MVAILNYPLPLTSYIIGIGLVVYLVLNTENIEIAVGISLIYCCYI